MFKTQFLLDEDLGPFYKFKQLVLFLTNTDTSSIFVKNFTITIFITSLEKSLE